MRTILHIEKSEFFCSIVRNSLAAAGYDYLSTGSFSEAFKIMHEKKVDAIVTSFYANGGTIKDFIEDINFSSNKGMPIFVVTGDDIDETKRELINLGVTDYILKKDLEDGIVDHINSVFESDQYMNNLKEAKIAIIDDSEFDISLEKDILENYDIHHVDCYSSGNDLLKSKKFYDIYLVDIILSNEFGENLIRKIRKDNLKCSIIAVTGLDNPKTLAAVLNSGADDFIIKPINEQLFISKLKSNIKTYTFNKQVNKLLKEMKK